MGTFADFLENELLDHIFNNGAWSAPATIYIALFTTATDDAGGGTEVTGGSYARKSSTSADWGAASSGSITTTSDITFVEATASWGTVSHFAIYDALTAGNMLMHDELTTPKAIGSGDTAKFTAGDLTVTLD